MRAVDTNVLVAGHLLLGTFDRELGKVDGARRL